MKRILHLTLVISLILIFSVSCGTRESANTPSNGTDNITGNDLDNDTDNNTNTDTDNNTDNNAGDVNPDNPVVEEEYTFTAKVLETEGGLMISPDEETNEIKSSDKIVVHTTNTKFFDKNGKEITIDKLQVGDPISVVYGGEIMESYPAQIGAVSITLTEDKELMEAYKAVIDDIYQEDSGLNSDISLIALDLSDITDLTEEELDKLANMVEADYNIDVIRATYKELIEQGLVDEDKLYFETGILINIIEPKYDKEEMLLTYGIEKWRSGLGAIGSNNASARFEDGEWKITKEDMWIS